MPPRPSRVEERQRRYRQGHRGEWMSAAYLKAKGYRILGRRVATGAGEIDIIALRRGRVAFVEVKRRSDLAAAEASVSSRQRQRIHRAADLWLAHHASYQTCQMGFDLIFVLPWRLPKHLPDAL